MLHTKLASVTVAAFLMTLIWTLPTAYAVHCKGQHANDPLCPPPPADVHDELKAGHAGLATDHADHADLATDHDGLVTDHDGLGLASEHTGLATDNDGLTTDHDALATDHDGLALGAPASELVTLIDSKDIPVGGFTEPTAVDVSDAKFITILGVTDLGGGALIIRYNFLSSSGTFNDSISKSISKTCNMTSNGIGDFTSGPDKPCSSQIYGPFFAMRITNNDSNPAIVTIKAWLQK